MPVNPNAKLNNNSVHTSDYSKIAKPVLKSNVNTSDYLRKEFESGRQYARNVTEEVELAVSTNNAENSANNTNTTKVLGTYNGNGKVYYTAEDAINDVNALAPDLDKFNGKYTYEAFYNGQFYTIEAGESIESILAKIGAENIDDVAIRVMDENGNDLTWESLKNLVKENTDQNDYSTTPPTNNGSGSSGQNGVSEKREAAQKVLEEAEKIMERDQIEDNYNKRIKNYMQEFAEKLSTDKAKQEYFMNLDEKTQIEIMNRHDPKTAKKVADIYNEREVVLQRIDNYVKEALEKEGINGIESYKELKQSLNGPSQTSNNGTNSGNTSNSNNKAVDYNYNHNTTSGSSSQNSGGGSSANSGSSSNSTNKAVDYNYNHNTTSGSSSQNSGSDQAVMHSTSSQSSGSDSATTQNKMDEMKAQAKSVLESATEKVKNSDLEKLDNKMNDYINKTAQEKFGNNQYAYDEFMSLSRKEQIKITTDFYPEAKILNNDREVLMKRMDNYTRSSLYNKGIKGIESYNELKQVVDGTSK